MCGQQTICCCLQAEVKLHMPFNLNHTCLASHMPCLCLPAHSTAIERLALLDSEAPPGPSQPAAGFSGCCTLHPAAALLDLAWGYTTVHVDCLASVNELRSLTINQMSFKGGLLQMASACTSLTQQVRRFKLHRQMFTASGCPPASNCPPACSC